MNDRAIGVVPGGAPLVRALPLESPRWKDESPVAPPAYPAVRVIFGEDLPHLFPYLSDIQDEHGLRVKFACAVVRRENIKVPWVIIDAFDMSVLEPNKHRRQLSVDYVAERARSRGALVARYAKAHKLCLGYIPYVAGAYIDKTSVEYAKLGGIVPLVSL